MYCAYPVAAAAVAGAGYPIRDRVGGRLVAATSPAAFAASGFVAASAVVVASAVALAAAVAATTAVVAASTAVAASVPASTAAVSAADLAAALSPATISFNATVRSLWCKRQGDNG